LGWSHLKKTTQNNVSFYKKTNNNALFEVFHSKKTGGFCVWLSILDVLGLIKSSVYTLSIPTFIGVLSGLNKKPPVF
jgi:hypothetical protein